MRTKEVISASTFEAKGNKARILDYTLCFPDDFRRELRPAVLAFSPDRTSFKADSTIQQDILKIRHAQLANGSVEHWLLRVENQGLTYSLENVLPGTNNGIGCRVYQKKLYEGGSLLASEAIPINEVDFFHSHTLAEDVEPEVSNLFSAGDVLSLGNRRTQRFWMIGLDGRVQCLINLGGEKYYNAGYDYGAKFRAGLTYAETLRDLLTCVSEAEWELYQSEDGVNFRRLGLEDAIPVSSK